MKVAGGGAIRGWSGETGGPGIKRYDISCISYIDDIKDILATRNLTKTWWMIQTMQPRTLQALSESW